MSDSIDALAGLPRIHFATMPVLDGRMAASVFLHGFIMKPVKMTVREILRAALNRRITGEDSWRATRES